MAEDGRAATQATTALPVHSAWISNGCQPATAGNAGTLVHALTAGVKEAAAVGWITTICVPVQTTACKSSIPRGSGEAGIRVQVRPTGS